MVASIPGGHNLGIMNEYGMSLNAMKEKQIALRMIAIHISFSPMSTFQRFTHTISMLSVGNQSKAINACHLLSCQPFEATL
mmetsp:Transcript_84580/g.181211  ORF Transcript_84580/g.181211 Transcript_84580/m.181211 type:complete len:81 (-) Transcript_84580:980-1222(-)